MNKPVQYYFIIGSKQFLVNEEPLEEVLRERVQHYSSNDKPIDFWLLPNPSFLNAKVLNGLMDQVPSNSLAIVSTNKVFITWLKLRLNNVLSGQFSAPSDDIICPLAYDGSN